MRPLLDRTIYVETPPLRSGKRLVTAPARVAVCFRRAPRLALDVLNPVAYGRTAISLSALHRLYRLTQAPGRYDMLHAHFGMVGNRFRFAGALWGAPFIVSFHGSDYSVWPRIHGTGCYRRLFASADAITANSEHTRWRLVQLGCPAEKIHTVYSAWDMEAFAFAEHPRQPTDLMRVLTVGRLVEKKGIEYAIRAVALARESHPHIRYDIIGEGVLRARLERLIAALGLGEHVILHGARTSAEVRQMMAVAHAFLLPSVTAADGDEEGQGVALVEAQATGLPVLATQHGPFPEVVGDGVTGFLVPERDHRALAERLISLIEHPEIATEMGRCGRRRVEERFDSRMLDRQVMATYEWAIEQFRQSRSLATRSWSGLLASVARRPSDQTTIEQAAADGAMPSSERNLPR